MVKNLRSRVDRLEDETGQNGPERISAVIIEAVEPSVDGSPPDRGKAVYAIIPGTATRPGFTLNRHDGETEEAFAERVEQARREAWS